MKTNLDHLPDNKRDELERATAIIREACAPEMIILFGSYARGDWVEELAEDETNYRYQSDFDLLVVTDTERKAMRIERDRGLRGQLLWELRTSAIPSKALPSRMMGQHTLPRKLPTYRSTG